MKKLIFRILSIAFPYRDLDGHNVAAYLNSRKS
jgi:hypothetical protein